MEGQTIENYQIEELLGQGGMGAVYRATDMSLDRSVALKIMNPGVATNADFLRRFKSEARVLGRLQHPNIVNVYTFRHVDSHLIIVMEYVGGGTLSDLIDQHGAVPVRRATELIKQSLDALEFAHSSNIIHRDIKPPNILLTENMLVKVSDFGLAKIQEDSNATMVTRVGMTGGTLHYMPPEQTEALSNVDHRGDIYSLGMTFYQMLAGRVPFDRNSSAFSILRAIDQQSIPTPDSFNSTIPGELVNIVMKSINKFPDDRYQSASEMRAAIDEFEGEFEQPPGGFQKTQILSRAPLKRDSGNPSFSSKKGKTPSGHDERFAVGSRHSSKVKKSKKPSRAPMAGGIVEEEESSGTSKKWIPIVGVLLLVLAGVFVGPRLFSSSPSEDVASNTNNTTQNGAGEAAESNAGTQQPEETAVTTTPPPEETAVTTTPPPEETPETTSNSSSNTTSNSTPAVQTRTVTVRSSPSGATVTMNGRTVGQTPLTVDNVPVQVQSFELSLAGHQSVSQTLNVARQTSLNATLTPLTGQIRIVVRPFGDIFINGTQKASNTNRDYQDELPVGTHTITARHPAFGNWDKEVTIRANQAQDVNFNFAQKFTVTVVSQPPNAEIIVDGDPIMTSRGPVTTPRQLQLPPGNHSITVRLQGFRVSNGPIDIVLEEDLSQALSFTLETQ